MTFLTALKVSRGHSFKIKSLIMILNTILMRDPNLLFIFVETVSLKNRPKSDRDLVTTWDPPVKSVTDFVIFKVELPLIGYWFCNTYYGFFQRHRLAWTDISLWPITVWYRPAQTVRESIWTEHAGVRSVKRSQETLYSKLYPIVLKIRAMYPFTKIFILFENL